MSRYDEYIQRMCRNGKYTPDQARQQALSREVKKYYETENETAPKLRHEFNCLSETSGRMTYRAGKKLMRRRTG